MEKKGIIGKKLDELLSITDNARFSAIKKDISSVSSFLDKRKGLLETIRASCSETRDISNIKERMESVLEKDFELKKILQEYKKETKKEIETFRKAKKLRMRFSGKLNHVPKFIDRKI